MNYRSTISKENYLRNWQYIPSRFQNCTRPLNTVCLLHFHFEVCILKCSKPILSVCMEYVRTWRYRLHVCNFHISIQDRCFGRWFYGETLCPSTIISIHDYIVECRQEVGSCPKGKITEGVTENCVSWQWIQESTKESPAYTWKWQH